MKGATPQPIAGTEFEIECDMIISAIGQMADLAEGLERLDNGRGGDRHRSCLQGPEERQAFRRRRRRSAASVDDRDRPRPHRGGDDRPISSPDQLGERRPKVDVAPVQPARRTAQPPSRSARLTTTRRTRGTDRSDVRGPQLRGSRRRRRSSRTTRCSRASSLRRARASATNGMSRPRRCSAISPSASSR